MRPSRSVRGERSADAALDELVARVNPVSDEAVGGSGLERGFDLLRERIMSTAATRRRWRLGRRRAVALTVAFAVVVVGSGSALAGMYTTHTGFFPPQRGTENDTTEFLRTDAPDFPPLVRRLVRDIPFPPGDSAEARVPRYLRQERAVPGMVQALGVKGSFTFLAVCSWRGYWLQEHRRGDAAASAMAAKVLATIATSKVEKQVDSFWPIYLDVAHREAGGDASAPRNFTSFYRVNCVGLPTPWAGK